jgi:hypothetical protein
MKMISRVLYFENYSYDFKNDKSFYISTPFRLKFETNQNFILITFQFSLDGINKAAITILLGKEFQERSTFISKVTIFSIFSFFVEKIGWKKFQSLCVKFEREQLFIFIFEYF